MNELRDDQAAAAMGMTPEGLNHAWATVRSAVARGDAPGAVAILSRRGRRVRYAIGHAVDDATGLVPVAFDTIYDCASLTKSTVTLPLAMMLIDRGLVRLGDPVAEWIPPFAQQGKQSVTVGHLLTHMSGLAPFYDMHSHGWTREKVLSFIYGSTLQYEPGTQVVYSDLGFILLGEIIAIATGMPLDQAARQYLFDPLGMKESGYNPSPELLPRIAATEFDAAIGACYRGTVHDENARTMGGVSGHAGLFSTADDLMTYAEMWLANGRHGEKQVLSQAAVRTATTKMTQSAKSGNRGLGWVLKGDRFDAAGDYLSASAYGHTGFTGTSMYIDPENELGAVLLTNRVHYGREKSVVGLRAKFHNAAAAALVD